MRTSEVRIKTMTSYRALKKSGRSGAIAGVFVPGRRARPALAGSIFTAVTSGTLTDASRRLCACHGARVSEPAWASFVAMGEASLYNHDPQNYHVR